VKIAGIFTGGSASGSRSGHENTCCWPVTGHFIS